MPDLPASPGQPAGAPMPTPAKVPPGPTGPATMAPDQSGKRMQGIIRANIGLTMLEQAAGLLGGTASEDGREVLTAVLKLRKRFGGASQDLQKQEVKVLGERVGGVQSPTPMQGQAWQQAIRGRQAQQGLPAAAAPPVPQPAAA